MGLPLLHDASGGTQVCRRPEPPEGILSPQHRHRRAAQHLPGVVSCRFSVQKSKHAIIMLSNYHIIFLSLGAPAVLCLT